DRYLNVRDFRVTRRAGESGEYGETLSTNDTFLTNGVFERGGDRACDRLTVLIEKLVGRSSHVQLCVEGREHDLELFSGSRQLYELAVNGIARNDLHNRRDGAFDGDRRWRAYRNLGRVESGIGNNLRLAQRELRVYLIR